MPKFNNTNAVAHKRREVADVPWSILVSSRTQLKDYLSQIFHPNLILTRLTTPVDLSLAVCIHCTLTRTPVRAGGPRRPLPLGHLPRGLHLPVSQTNREFPRHRPDHPGWSHTRQFLRGGTVLLQLECAGYPGRSAEILWKMQLHDQIGNLARALLLLTSR